mmetsp:Transcript_136755/g.354632  ORF Transcript_136755/g.354632 Transcript_136755/m.354632 type:complete len:183 (-) Transcript_136755:1472-2020(-)
MHVRSRATKLPLLTYSTTSMAGASEQRTQEAKKDSMLWWITPTQVPQLGPLAVNAPVQFKSRLLSARANCSPRRKPCCAQVCTPHSVRAMPAGLRVLHPISYNLPLLRVAPSSLTLEHGRGNLPSWLMRPVAKDQKGKLCVCIQTFNTVRMTFVRPAMEETASAVSVAFRLNGRLMSKPLRW